MRLRFRLTVFLLFLAMTILLGRPAASADLRTTFRSWLKPKPPYNEVPPTGVSVGPPNPYRYTGGNPCKDWYGYGFGVPTYNWGYFGARYSSVSICHKGYYGDYYQWGYRQGY